jgi:hypothetical protein
MYEGEISEFLIKPSYAFGAKGVPGMIPPDSTVVSELELIEIIPSVKRAYKSVGLNESIKDELLEKIESGETVFSKEVVDPGEKTSNKTNVRMFDEKTMKLNPNQVVGGHGLGHSWEETPRSIDIEVPTPTGTTKSDLIVEVTPTSIRVALRTGVVLIDGPLHGKINPGESSWALAPHDPKAWVKGEKVILSLEKSYSTQEIWATVFDREFLKSKMKLDE